MNEKAGEFQGKGFGFRALLSKGRLADALFAYKFSS